MSCAETEAAYKSFMNSLIGTKKGIERNAYMEGHRDANQYFLSFIDQLPEEEKSAFNKLKNGAENVIKCIDRIKAESEENVG